MCCEEGIGSEKDTNVSRNLNRRKKMNSMRTTDTIAAISTALSEAGIAIIRISGDSAIEIADKICRFKNKEKKLKSEDSHTIHYAGIVDGDAYIDEALVMLMRAPHTYTGEDVVEIDCHGGVLVTKKVLEAALKAGAVLAQPGEFTRRAFLNGKLDLSKAEAVIDIIKAQNNYALRAGQEQLSGRLEHTIKELRGELREQIAYIEAALDDPEHYDLSGYPEELETKTNAYINKIDILLEASNSGIIMKEGVDTVILGRPNAGKSSLLNYMLGKERAIVTDIAGTTRDTITESINLGEVTLNITDTAGIRKSSDKIEMLGVDKAKEAAENADLVLCVIDASSKMTEDDIDILNSIEDKKAIILLNKSDKETLIDESEIKKYTKHIIINISALDGSGIDTLTNEIKNMFYMGAIDFNNQIYITSVRHKRALEDARAALCMVEGSIESGMPEDFFSIDLMRAYEALGIITGESVDDEIIDEIFSKFCMGK